MKTIGVLGGMGPESTARFYQEMIKECQKQYGAKYDEDYPKMIIFNTPIPDIVENVKNKKEIMSCVIKNLKQLEQNKANFVVVPCNTINIIYKDMCNSVKIPVLSIVEETAKKTNLLKIDKIGLLATAATIKYKLYEKALRKNFIRCITPSTLEQRMLTKAIMNVLKGKKTCADKQVLLKIIKNLKSRGAEAVVIGCTDLSLLINQQDTDVKLLDTLRILAESTIRYARTKTI